MKKIKRDAFKVLVKRYIDRYHPGANVLMIDHDTGEKWQEKTVSNSDILRPESVVCYLVEQRLDYDGLLDLYDKLAIYAANDKLDKLYLFCDFFPSLRAIDELRDELIELSGLTLRVVDRGILVSFYEHSDEDFHELNGYEQECWRFYINNPGIVPYCLDGTVSHQSGYNPNTLKNFNSYVEYVTLIIQEYLIQHKNFKNAHSQELKYIDLELQFISDHLITWREEAIALSRFRIFCQNRIMLMQGGKVKSFYRLQGLCCVLLMTLWGKHEPDRFYELEQRGHVLAITRIVDRMGKMNAHYTFIFECMAAYIPISLLWKLVFDDEFLILPASRQVLRRLIKYNRYFEGTKEKNLLLTVMNLYSMGQEMTSTIVEKISESAFDMVALGVDSENSNVRNFITKGHYRELLGERQKTLGTDSFQKTNTEGQMQVIPDATLKMHFQSRPHLIWTYTYDSEQPAKSWTLTIEVKPEDSAQEKEFSSGNEKKNAAAENSDFLNDDVIFTIHIRGTGLFRDINEVSARTKSREMLLTTLRKCMEVKSYGSAEVVGLWYEAQYDGRIPERTLIFDDHVQIHREENAVCIETDSVLLLQKKDHASSGNTNFFFHNAAPENRRINNIVAVVGKNGAGKTTAFRMISQDNTRFSKGEYGAFVVVYRIQDRYYFSKHDPNNKYEIQGIASGFDITADLGKNSTTIFFSSALSVDVRTQIENLNGIDISNGYIWNHELMANSAERFYDVGRKIQLLKDRSVKGFHEMFHFLPGYFHFLIPEECAKTLRAKTDKIWLESAGRVEKNHKTFVDLKMPLLNPDEDKSTVRDAERIYKKILNWISDQANAASSREEQRQIRSILREMAIEIPGLSSGQYAIFDFYARLHSFFASQVPSSTGGFNNFVVNTGLRNYILLLDEIELYLHPQWQKGFIEQLIDYLEWEQTYRKNLEINPYENIQILISSNSPFFMSDLPMGNICLLYANDQEEEANIGRKATFAQNIHTLMKTSFFMGDGLNGDFSSRKIREAFEDLEDPEQELSEERKEEIKYLISIIGEPLIAKSLQTLYDSRFPEPVENADVQAVVDFIRNNYSAEVAQDMIRKLRK